MTRPLEFQRLDKKKFYTYGLGVFSGITICLFPLTVIKTRHIAGSNSAGLRGVQQTASDVWRINGLRGFYKGFGTVCVGTIPTRVIYMSMMELSKSTVYASTDKLGYSREETTGFANFVSGSLASLSTQTLFIPVDVVEFVLSPKPSSSVLLQVSQRLMVKNCVPGEKRWNGISMAKLIIRQEGLRGLWKGFGPALALNVPASAIWWGSYGYLQQIIWNQLYSKSNVTEEASDYRRRYVAVSDSVATQEILQEHIPERVGSPNDIVVVQTLSALLSGVNSALLTTPLDVVKTNMQLAVNEKGKKRVTIADTVQKIFSEHGVSGFMRGFIPRAANACLWGTCMVSAYEFLKRASTIRD